MQLPGCTHTCASRPRPAERVRSLSPLAPRKTLRKRIKPARRRALPPAAPSPLTLAARAGQQAPERGAQQQARPAGSRPPGTAATAPQPHPAAPQRMGPDGAGRQRAAAPLRSRPAAGATGEPGGGDGGGGPVPPPRRRPRRGGPAAAAPCGNGALRDGGRLGSWPENGGPAGWLRVPEGRPRVSPQPRAARAPPATVSPSPHPTESRFHGKPQRKGGRRPLKQKYDRNSTSRCTTRYISGRWNTVFQVCSAFLQARHSFESSGESSDCWSGQGPNWHSCLQKQTNKQNDRPPRCTNPKYTKTYLLEASSLWRSLPRETE